MKTTIQVTELLNLTVKQLKNIIDPNRNHRAILDELGCHKEGNTYLFSEDGIRYIAYQYMNKNKECFYYIYPDKRPKQSPAVKKVIKNVKRN